MGILNMGILSFHGYRPDFDEEGTTEKSAQYLREKVGMTDDQLEYLENAFGYIPSVQAKEQIILCRPFTKFLRWLPLSVARAADRIALCTMIGLGIAVLYFWIAGVPGS